MSPSLFHAVMLTGLHLHRSCVGNQSHCELMSTVVLSCPEDIVSSHYFLLLALAIFPFLLLSCLLSFGGGWFVISWFYLWLSMPQMGYVLHGPAIRFCVKHHLYLKASLMMTESCTNVWEQRYKRGGSLILCALRKIVVDPPLGLVSSSL